MADIQEYLEQIATAQKGKDVRQAIYDGIHQCYEDGRAGSIDLIARETKADKSYVDSSINAVNVRINTVSNDVAKEVSDRAIKDTELTSRIDNLVVGAGGNSPIEVTDAHVGTDGTTYATLKARLDGENSQLSESITGISNEIKRVETNYKHIPTAFVNNEYVKKDGTFDSFNGWKRTDFIPINRFGSKIKIMCEKFSDYNCFYNSNKNFIKSFSCNIGKNEIDLNGELSEAKYMILSNEDSVSMEIYTESIKPTFYHILGTGQSLSVGAEGYPCITNHCPDEMIGRAYMFNGGALPRLKYEVRGDYEGKIDNDALAFFMPIHENNNLVEYSGDILATLEDYGEKYLLNGYIGGENPNEPTPVFNSASTVLQKEIIKANSDVTITVANGFKMMVATFSDNKWGKSFISKTGWIDGTYVIPNGTFFALQLRRDDRSNLDIFSARKAISVEMKEFKYTYQGETISSALAYRFCEITGEKCIVSQHGIGGLGYSDLKKGTIPYNNLITAVKSAKAICDINNWDYEVLAITVVHGEADLGRGTTEIQYKNYLKEWISDFNTDIKAITSQVSDVSMYLSQTVATSASAYHKVTNPIASADYLASMEDSRINLSTPQYWFKYASVHMQPNGYRKLGEYFGIKIARDFNMNVNMTVYPIKVEHSDNTVTITFNNDIQLADRIVPQRSDGNYGFTFSNPNISISHVTISGNKAIITLSGTPSNGDHIEYAYRTLEDEYNHIGVEGVRGCICSTGNLVSFFDDADYLYGSNQLVNFVCVFSVPISFQI